MVPTISRAITGIGAGVHIAVTMTKRGLLIPGRPDRTAGQLAALRRWGLSLAGGYVSAARRDPHAPAVTDDEGTVSYAELDDRTDRLATALSEYAPGGTPRVGVLCRNHRGLIEVMIACAKLGADLVLLNTGLSTPQLSAATREHSLSVLIADGEFTPLLPDDSALPELVYPVDAPTGGTSLESLISTTSHSRQHPPASHGRTIVLTSGTTGQPKGAKRPTPALHSLTAMLSRIPLRVHDKILIAAPLFHTWGYAALQLSMAMRAHIVLRRRFDAADTIAQLAAQQCTSLFAVPVMLQRMLEVPADIRQLHDVSALRVAASSGSALPGDLPTRFMDAFGEVLYNLYGTTEVSWASIATPDELRHAPTTSGRPPHGTRIVIRDDAGQPVSRGTTGHVFVGNEMLFEGYTNGSARTLRDGTMDSGDLGHLDQDGLLFIDGRSDDMIVSGGENVYPLEVENLLNSHPEVQEAAVLGVADEKFGQRLVAYVVRGPDSGLTADDVCELVRGELARFSVPREVHFIAELPRNATGKVVARRLTEPDG